jgi:hypothetical protein
VCSALIGRNTATLSADDLNTVDHSVCSALIGGNTATLSADDLNAVDSDLLTCAVQSLQDIASSVRKGNGGGDQEESEEDDDDATSSGVSEPKQRTVSDAREAIATLTDFLLTHTLTSPDDVFGSHEILIWRNGFIGP